MDGWKTSFLLGRYLFKGYVKLREGTTTTTTTAATATTTYNYNYNYNNHHQNGQRFHCLVSCKQFWVNMEEVQTTTEHPEQSDLRLDYHPNATEIWNFRVVLPPVYKICSTEKNKLAKFQVCFKMMKFSLGMWWELKTGLNKHCITNNQQSNSQNSICWSQHHQIATNIRIHPMTSPKIAEDGNASSWPAPGGFSVHLWATRSHHTESLDCR